MRKVKVAAAFMCLLVTGMLGEISFTGIDMSVAKAIQSDQLIELTAEPVTTTTSIETTATVTTTATTKRTKVTTTSTAVTSSTAKTTATTSATVPDTTVSTTETSETEVTTTETEAELPQTTVLTDLTETVTEAVTEAPQTEEADTDTSSRAISVTDREYIMLCNVVGHEYGSDFVPVKEKALVAEVIMNRVNSPLFPNTIYEVLMQENQFAGLEYLVEMDTMSHYVTDSVKEAVDLYLSDPSQFDHGYLFFNGDGKRNYFRTSL